MMIINNALTDMNNVTNRFANQPTANGPTGKPVDNMEPVKIA